MESLLRAQRLIAQQMGDAPKELQTTIDLAMNALRQDGFGDALNLLNRAHDLIEHNQLNEWKAEMSACWAVFYFRTGNERMMLKAIDYAQKREPTNKRIAALKTVIADE